MQALPLRRPTGIGTSSAAGRNMKAKRGRTCSASPRSAVSTPWSCWTITACGIGGFQVPPIVDRAFHQAVTGLALAWALTGLAVLILQKNRIFPAGLKYATTAADLVFLTLVLCLAAGPNSPLVIGYFLIIVLATLRFSLGLVRFAAAGAVAGYLFVLGHGKWFAQPPRTVPRHQQLIVVIGLALTGVMLGQIVRRAARMAEGICRPRARPARRTSHERRSFLPNGGSVRTVAR